MASLVKKPCSSFLVAEEANDDGLVEVAGCVHVTWSGTTDSKQPGVDAHFGILSVPKQHAGRGIGRILVSAAGKQNPTLYLVQTTGGDTP